jgi:hypothetical protein
VLYREHHDRLAEVVKADTLVTGSQPKLGRFDILEPLDIALTGGEIASQNALNVEGFRLIDSAKVGFGWFGPGDLLRHR